MVLNESTLTIATNYLMEISPEQIKDAKDREALELFQEKQSDYQHYLCRLNSLDYQISTLHISTLDEESHYNYLASKRKEVLWHIDFWEAYREELLSNPVLQQIVNREHTKRGNLTPLFHIADDSQLDIHSSSDNASYSAEKNSFSDLNSVPIRKEKPSIILSILFSILSFFVFHIAAILFTLIAGAILYLLLYIPVVGKLLDLLFLLRGDTPDMVLTVLSSIVASFSVLFILSKISKNPATSNATCRILGVILIAIHVLSLIVNLTYGNSIFANITYGIAGIVFTVKRFNFEN